ncbi:Phospholipase C phosphatidylinositol-specific Y domain [Arabidopsis thaliana x Arabidopsis arenosa]|uniref:Phospholipase C phosphatidylinositol-specific Y domain n=1 Tax=Arabidopsis thaliana x Arabidopsis arenosa TaxID=1240361 RepID=A0A8T1ZNG4_9BRAS|nr:Phospholipase C phosphatidylinositol-specific Y domain [Arabidopsis thaliana x Arabidopsis arenosa]
MVKVRKKFEMKRANQPDRVPNFFRNEFHGYDVDMPKSLHRFTEMLDKEIDEDGAGLKAAEQIAAELKRRHYSILKLPQLNEFLFSPELNPPIGDQVHHNMNAPLSHYFIHTSLKSYSTGNVFGRYSIEPIIDALKQGVRVVELDLLPFGKDGICVRRKWKFEKPLELQECLDAIKEHAFTPTRSYPVIITLKDSLKPDLQAKVTQMIDMTFGNMVYHHDPHSLELPSPTELQNKILISQRPPTELLYANDDEDGVEIRQESTDQNYQSVVGFHAVEPRGMLQKALTNNVQQPGWYERDVISFTQNRFLRTRPKTRILLSNAPYKPQRAWMHGAQMIALSRQDDKEKLWLMQGMFRANGGCGYVKKPNFLLNAGSSGVFYPTENPVVVKTLKVKIYMGDGWIVDFKKRIGRLYRPDLYVRISIAGVPHDEKITKTIVKYNEWKPTWGQEFTFPLTYPDLALISFEVYDYELSTADEFCGQTCLPVSELIEGIRAVPLYDERGEACSSTMLLTRFKWS